jgi:Uma2 family endonuclease
MSVDTRLLTADELLQMPDDGMKHELVRGELTTMPPPGLDHGDIAAEIATSMRMYAKQHGLGKVYVESGFLLATGPDTVRGPDVSFVRTERVVKSRKYFLGAPDIAVEVVSPDDRYSKLMEKVAEYLNAGTSVVIVVDPQTQTASNCTSAGKSQLTINDSLEAPDLLPGWSLPLRELFA